MMMIDCLPVFFSLYCVDVLHDMTINQHRRLVLDTIVYSRSEVANVCLRNSGFVQATDSRQGPF